MTATLMKIIVLALMVNVAFGGVFRAVECEKGVEYGKPYYPKGQCMTCTCIKGIEGPGFSIPDSATCASCPAVALDCSSENQVTVNPDGQYPKCCEVKCKK
ncbi:uncharacterized protein LOC115222397 [Argonauta hians]